MNDLGNSVDKNQYKKIGNKIIYTSGDKTFELDCKLKNCNCKYYLKYKICKHSLGYSNINDLNWFGKKFNDNKKFEIKEKRGRKTKKNYKRFPHAEKAGKALTKF